jgi:thiol-disulfide isomerase/thioredoxin
MFKRLAVLAILGLACAAGRSAAAEPLTVGDPAPKLEVKEFVKGDAVTGFEKGKVYVVEFWATWCGPCRATIPHLTELQKKHKDVTFIGVSAFETDQGAVKPFVKEMGDKMDYRVAMDDVPAGGKRDEGKMAKNWMIAAEQGGIPTAFIVNGDGKIAWIGHPTAMDKPLDEIVAGKWDLKAAVAKLKADQARSRKMREVRTKVVEAQRKNDPKALLAVLDELLGNDPDLEPQLGMGKFKVLAELPGSEDKAVEYGKHLMDKVFKDNVEGLNFIAWTVVDPARKEGPDRKEKPDPKLVKLALAAAQRADELGKGKEGHIADTLARAYFLNGDVAKALELQERAVTQAKGTPFEKDPGLQQRLEEYRKAAKK